MKYLDPKSDVTFKKVFGEHKELLSDDFRTALAEKYEKGLNEGMQIGEARGMQIGKIKTAKSLKGMGLLSDEQISAATDLSLDEIKKL